MANLAIKVVIVSGGHTHPFYYGCAESDEWTMGIDDARIIKMLREPNPPRRQLGNDIIRMLSMRAQGYVVSVIAVSCAMRGESVSAHLFVPYAADVKSEELAQKVAEIHAQITSKYGYECSAFEAIVERGYPNQLYPVVTPIVTSNDIGIVEHDALQRHIGNNVYNAVFWKYRHVLFITREEWPNLPADLKPVNVGPGVLCTLTIAKVRDDAYLSVDGISAAGAIIDRDPLFDEAVRFIVQEGIASIPSLQHRFYIDYIRAGRLMDQMESAGIVGPPNGAKPRAILVNIDPLRYDIKVGGRRIKGDKMLAPINSTLDVEFVPAQGEPLHRSVNVNSQAVVVPCPKVENVVSAAKPDDKADDEKSTPVSNDSTKKLYEADIEVVDAETGAVIENATFTVDGKPSRSGGWTLSGDKFDLVVNADGYVPYKTTLSPQYADLRNIRVKLKHQVYKYRYVVDDVEPRIEFSITSPTSINGSPLPGYKAHGKKDKVTHLRHIAVPGKKKSILKNELFIPFIIMTVAFCIVYWNNTRHTVPTSFVKAYMDSEQRWRLDYINYADDKLHDAIVKADTTALKELNISKYNSNSLRHNVIDRIREVGAEYFKQHHIDGAYLSLQDINAIQYTPEEDTKSEIIDRV